ncbi:MAG: glycogen/starch synthase, partial [Chlamydiae bacterium]|nr:glycogen/starch synthase [Chlamydiota bacterium]
YFCAAATALLESKEAPDVVHLHDWHTALVAKLYSSARTILTIHNLAYIGGCSKETLHKIGLMELSDFVLEDHYSLLRGGLVAADLITTVSPTYAEEILTKPFGGPFCQLLNGNRDKLVGILNGIDYSYWNPQRDEFLPFPYSSAMLSGKDEMKRMIQTKLDMPKEDNLLVTAIARLVEQKGPDLIEAAIRMTERRGGQFVLLGSASDPKTQEQFASLKKELAHNPNISLQLLYDEELAHQLFAAADLLIVPSLFEPCGLTQMIAMRYGTLPLVRKTGGLADTVIDGVDGFVFEEASSEAIEACLTRCFALFNSEKWTEMQSNALSRDWSWTIPTQTYLSHYQNLALR